MAEHLISAYLLIPDSVRKLLFGRIGPPSARATLARIRAGAPPWRTFFSGIMGSGPGGDPNWW